MTTKILINAVDPEECRIAIVKDNDLVDFAIETAAREITRGNIYKGVIARVEPSLQAVFVEYGADRHGFLQKQEIHHDYYKDTPDGQSGFTDLLSTGQELLVQVVKDPVGRKGAMLTTFISLAGSYVVLMPGTPSKGVSRQIEDEAERKRVKEVMDQAKVPEGFGYIVRTAANGQTKTALVKDVKNLMRLWKSIKKKGMEEKSPALLYKEMSLAVRAVRDYFTPDVSQVLVDDPAVYDEIRDFVKIVAPRSEKMVKLHKDDKPIFSRHQVEEKIASVFEARVPLKSGGSIVINPTEALVAVDVNSGKATREDSVEKTALTTNLEAAEEVARQLKLRDLGGLIVVDFIDMRERKHRAAVEKAVKDYMKTDKARVKVGKITQFGLLELSRQRIRPPAEYGSYVPCRHCQGKGSVPSVETMALSFLRRLRMEALRPDVGLVEGTVPSLVADYLNNRKRREIAELETRSGAVITIRADASLMPGQSQVKCENKS
ncbi:MAG: Rne/Rng family ribonuclease [Thermodesulfobacteriota bacterium]